MFRKKKLALLVVIPVFLIVLAIFTQRFLFREARISHELNIIIEGIALDISWEGVKIIEYRGRWSSMYTKLELSIEKYDQVKRRFLLFEGTVSNKDFENDILREQSRYSYNEVRFLSELSTMNKRINRLSWLKSMNLDDYEELLLLETTYGKLIGMTTGGRFYVLGKENSGNYYLYIIKI